MREFNENTIKAIKSSIKIGDRLSIRVVEAGARHKNQYKKCTVVDKYSNFFRVQMKNYKECFQYASVYDKSIIILGKEQSHDNH